MSFYDLVRGRESVRDYDPKRTIDNVVLNRILNAGRLAPSADNRQPWTFLLVSSTEKLLEVRACYKKSWFQQAPHILIIIGDKTKSWIRSYDGYNSIETDLAIECCWKELAQTQEEILWLCEAAHIPIVWATQVLETMAKKGRPSRAEITDAASAEQTECVMLNKGPHIFEVIKMLDEILSSMQDYHEKKAPMLPPLKMLKPDFPKDEEEKKVS